MLLARFPQLNRWDCVLNTKGDWTLPAPLLDAFTELDARVKGHRSWSLAMTATMSDAVDRFEAHIECGRDAIIREHLAPALQDVITQAAEAATEAEGSGERDELLDGPESSLRAWQRLEALAKRYDRLRTAQDRLSQDVATLDWSPVLFTEFYNGRRSVQPRFATAAEARPQWPTTSAAARLRWIVADWDAHPVWMPTPGERSVRWQDTYGDVPKPSIFDRAA
ncbi:MAG: hypothetical protein ACR2KG_11605 [Nocardioidaceae bacterium]